MVARGAVRALLCVATLVLLSAVSARAAGHDHVQVAHAGFGGADSAPFACGDTWAALPGARAMAPRSDAPASLLVMYSFNTERVDTAEDGARVWMESQVELVGPAVLHGRAHAVHEVGVGRAARDDEHAAGAATAHVSAASEGVEARVLVRCDARALVRVGAGATLEVLTRSSSNAAAPVHELAKSVAAQSGLLQRTLATVSSMPMPMATTEEEVDEGLPSTHVRMAGVRKFICAAPEATREAAFFLNAKRNASTAFGLVEPRIGSGGYGFGAGALPVVANVPFSQMRVGPDTTMNDVEWMNWRHFGGYHYCDNQIVCLSHMHMVGAGANDLGLLGAMPVNAINDNVVTLGAFKSAFRHETEVAEPGYYAVHLDGPNIDVEVTASDLIAEHRYRWHEPGAHAVVLLDVTHSLKLFSISDAHVTVDRAARQVRGHVVDQGSLSERFGGAKVFFVAEFDGEGPLGAHAVGTFDNTGIQRGALHASGVYVGAYVDLGAGVHTATWRMAISLVSGEQALANLRAGKAASFDATRARARARWSAVLARVEVEGGTLSDRVVTHTALYHAFFAPTNMTEAGRVYVGLDKGVHHVRAEEATYYSDMSIWDTHRTAAPLLTLLAPDVQSDVLRSLVLMHDQGGDLPRWPLLQGYTGCMDGTHADVILVDGLLKGLAPELDAHHVLAIMSAQATEPKRPRIARGCLTDYLARGYCPIESDKTGAVLTVEYAYDDYAISVLARALGNVSAAEQFAARSANWRNVFDHESSFVCPRHANGDFACLRGLEALNFFNPYYTEGDAWHYRWYVPHDVPSLIDAYGGKDAFVRELDTFLSLGRVDPSNFMPNPFYWAGNEEDLLAPWLFNWAGAPSLAHKHIRWLVRNRFPAAPHGVPGNDDYGTMSAWLVWAAAGVYPVPATQTYAVVPALFRSVTMRRAAGDVVFRRHGGGESGEGEVARFVVNGETRDAGKLFVQWEDIAAGGTVEVWVGDEHVEGAPGGAMVP